MSADVLPLDVILGPATAAAVLQQHADAIAHADHLPPSTALRLACERGTDGDPLLLAAPGQIWSLRPDVALDDAPARRLAVHQRLAAPPRVRVTSLDDDTDGQADELLIEVLEMYRLDSWTPVDALLEGGTR
ncbi:hypothetical protein E4198_00160 [Streptomyces sp. RKND-216]|uniref:hypothetical protein n=1 Tax=Streptomyces sp. RKND-216 TaxID=2562581 RepID=UPI00109E0077|nr:hypothetical protein [Streptomyces sp. RKND-216]THA28262.1 hypothetical protein E4198_00160 [Streptomyces sp. RKND-216]